MPYDSSRNDKGDDKESWGGNPFAAPKAEVDEIRGEAGEYALLPESNRLAAGAGIAWIREGWALMRGHIWAWIGMGFLCMLILAVLQLISIPVSIRGFLQILSAPVFIAGLMLVCRAKEQNEDVRVLFLFAGFSKRTGSLLLLGLLDFLLLLLAVMLTSAGFFLLFKLALVYEFFAGGSRNVPFWQVILFLALFIFAVIPFLIVQGLSPQLAALHEDMTAWGAFKLAVRGMLRNILPFLASGIAFFILPVVVLGIVFYALGNSAQILFWAQISLCLCASFLIPFNYCVFYAAYRDIFIRPR
ncbi:MAG: hypothetical protein LBU11_04750 [Zoogloeaceae bacterium]|jgi:hypothetical protein|nr:hypothetical protein [Zoogloeaceae bacterium]